MFTFNWLAASVLILNQVQCLHSLHRRLTEPYKKSNGEDSRRAALWEGHMSRLQKYQPYGSNYNYYRMQRQRNLHPYNNVLRNKLTRTKKKKPMKRLDGPKRGPNYDPSFGYEPYWADGGWVYQWWKEELKNNRTDMCDLSCPMIYSYYGTFCGRNKVFETREFTDFCELKELDCDDNAGWYIAYRGKCRAEIPTHPPAAIPHRTDPAISRATVILADYASRMANLRRSGGFDNGFDQITPALVTS